MPRRVLEFRLPEVVHDAVPDIYFYPPGTIFLLDLQGDEGFHHQMVRRLRLGVQLDRPRLQHIG